MRKIFTLALMCMLTAMAAMATETTIDLSAQGYANAADVTTASNGPVQVTFAKGTGGSTPKYYNSGTAVRLYPGNTLQVTSTATITKIEFTFSDQYTQSGTTKTANFSYGNSEAAPTVTSGSYTDNSATDGTWTGSTNDLTFTVSKKVTSGVQVRIKKMVVTTEGEGTDIVANPTITPASGTYYNAIDVTLACGTTGASIYYTTNGDEPTASSTVYLQPFSLSTDATVKAIAIKGDTKSEVVSASYVFKQPTEVANIAAYQKVEDSTMVKFAGTLTVVAQNGNNLYVKDATGYALIYGQTGQSYKSGNVIPAGVVGEKITYNGEPELSVYASSGNFQASSGDETVTAETIQCSDVASDLFGHLVYIPGVTLSGYATGSSFTCKDNSGSVPGYFNMGASKPDSTKTWNMTAVIGSYRSKSATVTTYRVHPISFTDVNGQEDGAIANIAAFNALADSTTAKFSNSVTVLAQSGSNLFVQDETGYMLVYGSTGQTYKNGDVIPAGFSGMKVTYNSFPEMTKPSGFTAASGNSPVAPKVVTISEITNSLWGAYVQVNNAIIDTAATTLKVGDASIAYYTRTLGVAVPTDGKEYNVTAIVSAHSGNLQLLPVAFTRSDGSEVEVPEVANLDGIYALNTGVTAKFTSALTAVYQNGRYLYIKDAAGKPGLVYGSLDNTYNNGDQITGAEASWTTYQGLKQLTPVASTFGAGVAGTAVQPTEVALEDISQDMGHQSVVIKNASIAAGSNARTLTINDGTIDMVMYLQFTGVTAPTVQASDKYSITGFVAMHSNVLQILPVSFEKTSAVDDINVDNNAPVEYYNLQGIKVSEPKGGIFIRKQGSAVSKVLVK